MVNSGISVRKAAEQLYRGICAQPEHTAVACYTGEGWIRLDYGQLKDRIENWQQRLNRSGVRAGDPVALVSENAIEWLVAYLALLFSGAIPVLVDAKLPSAVLQACLDIVGPEFVCCATGQIDKMPGRFDAGADAVRLAPDFFLHRDHWQNSPEDRQSLDERLTDVAAILFTSGTSGHHKAVMLTAKNFEAAVIHAESYTSPRIFSILPWSHVFGLVCHIYGTLSFSNTLVFTTELKPRNISAVFQEEKPTTLLCVPRLLEMIHSQFMTELRGKPPWVRGIAAGLMKASRLAKKVAGINPAKVFFKAFHQKLGGRLAVAICGGSALADNVFTDLEALGLAVICGYGLTEVTGSATINRLDKRVAGSVGHPAATTRIRIQGPDQERRGEICIQGDIVMRGYYGDPEATRACIRDGWFYTGDIGYLDDQNRLYITGRKKDIIVTAAGYKTTPAAVEALYTDIAGIEALAVVGIHDPQGGGDVIHAAVVAQNATATPSETERLRHAVLQHGDGDIPFHMRIREAHFLPSLPITTTMKVRRREIIRLIKKNRSKRPAHPDGATPNAGVVLDAKTRTIAVQLAKLLAESLNLDPESIDMDMPVVHYCTDSLRMVQFISAAEETFGCSLNIGRITMTPSVAAMADFICNADRIENPRVLPEITRAAPDEKVQLTYAEASMFRALEWDEHGTNPGHKVIGLYEITGDLATDRLQQAVNILFQHHEALRTSYRPVDGGWHRKVSGRNGCTIRTQDLSKLTPDGQKIALDEMIRVVELKEMDLSKPPLAEIRVVILAPGRRMLIFSLHHLICDGWSVAILADELSAIYNSLSKGQEMRLPEPAVELSDYAAWQHRCEKQGLFDTQLNYWSQSLNRARPVLLPETYRFHSDLGRTSDHFFLVLTEDITGYESFAEACAVTLPAMFITVMQLLMNRLFGREEHVFHCFFHGRTKKSLQSMIGFIADNFIMSTRVDMEQPVIHVLRSSYRALLDHMKNADVPSPLVYNLEQPAIPLWEVLKVPVAEAKAALRRTKQLPLVCTINMHLYDAITPQFDGCRIRRAEQLISRQAWWRPGFPELRFDINLQDKKVSLLTRLSSELSGFLSIEEAGREFLHILTGMVENPDEMASTIKGRFIL